MKVLKVIILFGLWTMVCGFSLKEAQKDYLVGNYSEAIRKARSVRETDESLYFLGLVHTKTGRYQRARNYLEKLIRTFPKSQFNELGLIKLADTYFLEGNYEKAKTLYKRIEKDYFFSDFTPVVLLRLAQIASRQGKWQEKNEYLKMIKQKYPESSEMKFVKALEGYGDFFTIQVGAFGEKRNAFLLREELREDYKPYIVEDKKGNYPVHKVRIGKFKKRYDAEKTANALRNQGYPARIYP
jgi:tetratricopeptide (TPR) repeat protein